MSRFVPAGAGQSSEQTTSTHEDDAWTKAREKIDHVRQSKTTPSAGQEDGRSLYEVLQANKAAKQEALEEATKLRNQFRPLDDSEIEFLDSVRAVEKRNEAAVEQEAAEQLDAYRRRRVLADRQAKEQELQAQAGNKVSSSGTESSSSQVKGSHNSWTASKKRRRPQESTEDSQPLKQKQNSSVDERPTQIMDTPVEARLSSTNPDDTSEKNVPVAKGTTSQMATGPSQPASAALGLLAYDSDSDSNSDG